MARRGFHYDRTVAHALIDLVKDGALNREGRPRRYQCVQKMCRKDRHRLVYATLGSILKNNAIQPGRLAYV